MAIVISFVAPFTLFLSSIPSCVMGGVCIALYGFIAVSGLKMIQKVDLNENKNLFVVSVILIAGVGGFAMTFGKVVITSVACALILGILTNVLVNIRSEKADAQAEVTATTDGADAAATVRDGEPADNASIAETTETTDETSVAEDRETK